MGLTVSYDYHTVGRVTDKQVSEMMHDLLLYASQLKDDGVFLDVSELMHLDEEHLKSVDDEFERRRNSKDFDNFEFNTKIVPEGMEWAMSGLVTSGRSITKKYKTYKRYKRGWDYREETHSIRPVEAWIFEIDVANGSEEARFGLIKYPKVITIKNPTYGWGDDNRTDEFIEVKTGLTGWHWKTFCKTQFAAHNGLVNFLRGHVGLIAFLDYIKKNTPLEVAVRDEGEFWDNRNVVQLAVEVKLWETMLGSLALSLAGRDDVESPMFEWNPYDNEPPEGFEMILDQGNLQSVLSFLVQLGKEERETMTSRRITNIQEVMFWWRLMAETILAQAQEEDAIGHAASHIRFVLDTYNGKRYDDLKDVSDFAEAVEEYKRVT